MQKGVDVGIVTPTRDYQPVGVTAERGKTAGAVVRDVISLVALAVALYVILSGSNPGDRDWGFRTVAAVLGYWLRPPS